MALSTLSAATVAEYLHIETDDALISPLIAAAKSYCCAYTGHTLTELDAFDDVDMAALIWISDMYDQRTEHTDKPINNPAVETILSLYSCNLLPSIDDDEEEES